MEEIELTAEQAMAIVNGQTIDDREKGIITDQDQAIAFFERILLAKQALKRSTAIDGSDES